MREYDSRFSLVSKVFTKIDQFICIIETVNISQMFENTSQNLYLFAASSKSKSY